MRAEFDYISANDNTEIQDDQNDFESQYCVNYIWIGKTADPAEKSLCSVPLKLLDKAYENARQYPKAKFLIWVDKSMIDPLSDFFVLSHGYLSAPENIEFRNLREVETINELDFFNKGCDEDIERFRKANIWGRVDLARLLVLQHQLLDEPDLFQLYTDFDIPNVKLNDPKMHAAMQERGVFVGTDSQELLENGYLCFAQGEGQRFLEGPLLDKTKKSVLEFGQNGWSALRTVFNQEFGIDRYKYTAVRQPQCGYIVPDVQKYKDWGLN